MRIKESFGVARSVWSMTFKMARKRPCMILPFFVTAVFNAVALTVLFYSPRYPLSRIFAPLIKAFSNVRYLHYPANFLLLPKMFYYMQIGIMLTVGVLMFGMAVSLILHVSVGEKPRIAGSFNKSARRYFTLAGIWIIAFIISFAVMRVPMWLVVKFFSGSALAPIIFRVARYGGLLCILVIEAFLVFSYPAAIIEKRKLFSSIKRSFFTSKKVFLTMLILIFTPRIFEIVLIIIRRRLMSYAFGTVPEATLIILGVGIAVAFIADFLVMASITNLFILTKETEA